MTSKFVWSGVRQLRKVWVRVVFFALLAVATVAIAQVLSPLIPPEWEVRIGAKSVDQVLNILASAMLAVTTFSLAIATSAFNAAASTATPRATALLQEDNTAKNVLATFLGAFVFSLVAIVTLQAGYYDNAGRLVLFAATGGVIVLVVVMLLRWISHLMVFGRMSDTLDRVEEAARSSLEARLAQPFLGARPMVGDVPDTCNPVMSERAGYVLHVDLAVLNTLAEEQGVKFWVTSLPGSFVHKARALVHCDRAIVEADVLENIRAAFSIDVDRSFEQDPRFGVVVLSEIASRAMSPAVNDPGTAISVVGRLLRILSCWEEQTEASIEYNNLFVPELCPLDMITQAFRPIIRDAAGNIEVQVHLQKALSALAQIAPEAFSVPTLDTATDAKTRAMDVLSAADAAVLAGVYEELWEAPRA